MRGQKGTILFCQFIQVCSDKSGQKQTKKDKKGHIFSVYFWSVGIEWDKKGQKRTKGDNFIWSSIFRSKRNRDLKRQKGTISICQFHLFRRNKSGQKGTKEDKKGQIYSVNFIVHSYKSGQKGTKEDKKGHCFLTSFQSVE